MNRAPGGAELDRIEAIYRRGLPEFRRVATAITGDREVAIDAVQDAFALAVQKRGQFRGEGSMEGWLWRILVHTARDAARRQTRVSPLAPEDAAARSIPPEAEARGDLHALVGELPERQRVALFLRYYADLDYGAIADALEISLGTVGATLSQARENLRRRMAGVSA